MEQNFNVEDIQDWGVGKIDFGEDEYPEKEYKEPEDLSDKIKETFEVIVECSDEIELEKTFNNLTKQKYVCRILTL